MSNARMGRIAGQQRSDSTRTQAAKAQSITRKQQRTLKGWTPTPFDVERIASELARAGA